MISLFRRPRIARRVVAARRANVRLIGILEMKIRKIEISGVIFPEYSKWKYGNIRSDISGVLDMEIWKYGNIRSEIFGILDIEIWKYQV